MNSDIEVNNMDKFSCFILQYKWYIIPNYDVKAIFGSGV